MASSPSSGASPMAAAMDIITPSVSGVSSAEPAHRDMAGGAADELEVLSMADEAGTSSSGAEGKEHAPPVDPTVTNLHFFHSAVTMLPVVASNFQKVRVLADAIHGKVYMMRRKDEGDQVVVKKMPNMRVDQSRGSESNDRLSHSSGGSCMEDALNEIGVFQHLSRQHPLCNFILRLLGVFRDETYTWLVTEPCAGELFDVAASGAQLEEKVVRRWIWQLLQATHFLHAHNIGHRDISLENCLLDKKTGTDRNLKLMDFGQAVQLSVDHPVSGRTALRYFRSAGKNYYRAPEAYVPTRAIQAECPSGYVQGSIVQVPTTNGYLCEVQFPQGAAEGSTCLVSPMGYTVGPMDTFAVGVCCFVLHTQNPPWRQAVRVDELFKFIQANGVANLFQAWRKPLLAPSGMQLLSSLLQANPALRPDVFQALASEWFASVDAGAAAADGSYAAGSASG